MKRILILLACLLSLASCYAPVDLSLSQAVAVLRNPNVTYRATIGPIGDFGGLDATAELTFLPSKISTPPGNDFKSGFAVMRGATRTLVRYAASDGVFGWWGADYVNPVPAYEPYIMEPLKYAIPSASNPLGMLGMNPVDATGNSVQVVNADLPGRSFSYPMGWQNLHDGFVMPAYDADPIGFSVYPSDWGQGWDDTYWLVRERGSGQLRELTSQLDSSGLTGFVDTKAGSIAFDIPELAGVARCHYFFDPDPARGPTPEKMKSYASWYDATTSTWKCVSWEGMPVVSTLLTKVTHRVDALLTNGMLFSTEDGVGRLYDANGAQQAEFPLGALRFVGERIENPGVPVAVFSMARRIVQDYQARWYLDVYTVETADLAGL
jgi:hypothetical protein